MYVMIAVLPVPEGNREKYIQAAEWMANWSREHGALEVMEAWEDDVSDGQVTDYRKAVQAQPGEKIVVGWVIWPDRDTFKQAEALMESGEGMPDDPEEMPFDGKRLIYGGFEPLLTKRA